MEVPHVDRPSVLALIIKLFMPIAVTSFSLGLTKSPILLNIFKILFNIYTIFIVMLQWIASVQKLAKPLKVVHSVTSSFSFHRLSFPISCLSFPSSSFSCCTVLAAFAPWYLATKIATENKMWYKLDRFYSLTI